LALNRNAYLSKEDTLFFTVMITSNNQTVAQAIQEFYNQHDFGKDGGINEKYAWIKFGFISIPIPNAKTRRENIYLHDITHLVTGYETHWKGESSASAWEIASGGWRNLYIPWMLTLWAMGVGVLLYPSAVYQSFRRGLTMRNALTSNLSKEEILGLSIEELRTRLSNHPSSGKSPLFWMILSFIVFLTPFALGVLGLWLVLLNL
jgi:hypothetical protein